MDTPPGRRPLSSLTAVAEDGDLTKRPGPVELPEALPVRSYSRQPPPMYLFTESALSKFRPYSVGLQAEKALPVVASPR